jgi:o-succinylbenzoate---CoA ligase
MDRGEFVPDWLRQRAHSTPERLALVADATSWSFAQLDRRTDAAAAALREQGLASGQRVGIAAANGPGFVVGLHALMRLGVVVVPLNIRLTPAEIDWQRQDAELSHALDDAALQRLLEAPDAEPIGRDFDLAQPHSIIYTSGTTGRPKGAILTYGNYWWSAISSAINLGLQPVDRWLACLPLFHVGGLSILLRSAIYGITAEVHSRFDPAEVNQAIDEHGVTMVSLVSTMLERMLSERDGRPYPSTLRCVLLGGGPAPLPLLERALEAHAPVVQTYGLTETASQLATLAPEDVLRKVGSAGKPLMGSQIRIEADGEICVRGPSVSPGYFHRPAREDWLHTGDLGYLDSDGYLYVLDRRDDLIISGGENVYPAEVEAVLLSHRAVEDAGVFGIADAEWGNTVAAAVTLREGAAPNVAELLAFCRERLAGYKIPRLIEFRPSLPRTATGKLSRRSLRDEHAPRPGSPTPASLRDEHPPKA